ncbi:MAG: DNA polymerase III subunit beta [Enterobacteriaceae bacterium]
MKLIIKNEVLLNLLKKTIHTGFTNTNNKILNYLIFKVKNNKLFILSSNLEVEMMVSVDLKEFNKDGKSAILAKKIIYICRNFPKNSNILIKSDTNKVLVYSKNMRYSLNTMEVDDFPRIKFENKYYKYSISEKFLKKAINLLKFVAPDNDVRNYLNGILIEKINNILYITATDGHRLATYKILTDCLNNINSIIIPKKTVIEIQYLLEKDKEVNLLISNKFIKLKIRNYYITSKLINGKFPNYHHLLNKKYKKNIKIESNSFRNSLSRISILVDDKLRLIKIKIKKNKLKITTNNSIQEKAEEIIKIKNKKNFSIEIGVNIDYILDIVNVLKCKKIKFSFNDNISSLKIENMENKNICYILMPIMI